MSAWEIAGDAEFDPVRPLPRFRDPGPHEQVPGNHIAYSAQTQWCRACTERYGAPILWPCATYDYQQARDRFERHPNDSPNDPLPRREPDRHEPEPPAGPAD